MIPESDRDVARRECEDDKCAVRNYVKGLAQLGAVGLYRIS